jgi:hypothetical protein
MEFKIVSPICAFGLLGEGRAFRRGLLNWVGRELVKPAVQRFDFGFKVPNAATNGTKIFPFHI